ncbi:glutamate-1-semialdehyde aminotransferase [Vibrio sp. AND4]|nr:glutamate-1-semialdehyde aminotransferase [Vibrio sp. AND4]
MGCCNGDKKCQSEKKAKRIPWFGIVICVLVVLVLFNWQA